MIGLGSKPLDDTSEWYPLSGHREEDKTTPFTTEITTLSPTGSRISDEELSDYDEKFLAHTGNFTLHTITYYLGGYKPTRLPCKRDRESGYKYSDQQN